MDHTLLTSTTWTKYRCPCQILHIVLVELVTMNQTKSYLPQPVFFPKRLRSYDDLTIQQSEHVGDKQNCICPLSPRVHSRVVPCQRRFSFPADLPVATNCPRASTAFLSLISGMIRLPNLGSAYRYVSYAVKLAWVPKILYTCFTGGHDVPCLHDDLN